MAAEQKPDFSGEYVLNAQASALTGGAAAVRRAVLRFEHRDPIVRRSNEWPSSFSLACARGHTSMHVTRRRLREAPWPVTND
jgi:hypothetical protein